MRFPVAILATVCAVGCANAYQSAHTLPMGKTQVTAALTRSEALDLGEGGGADSVYVGDLQVRHGMSDQFEAGVRLQRNPGIDQSVSVLTFDPKFSLTKQGAKTAVSFSLPVGLLWAEKGLDPSDGTILITPSAFVGFELSPSVELVISPKLFIIKPDGQDSNSEVGGSIGLRISDETRTWAVQPEIGIVNVSEGDGQSFLTFGLGISAGN